MGWTAVSREAVIKPLVKFFERELNSDTPEGTFRIIDAAFPTPTEAYLACETLDKATGETMVIGMVIIMQWGSDGSLMYKEMEERTHPYYYRCPPRILKMLSPVRDDDSIRWRMKCLQLTCSQVPFRLLSAR